MLALPVPSAIAVPSPPRHQSQGCLPCREATRTAVAVLLSSSLCRVPRRCRTWRKAKAKGTAKEHPRAVQGVLNAWHSVKQQLRGRRAELENELLEAQEQYSAMEAQAKELQQALEEELASEQAVREIISRQLLSAQDSYGNLSDMLEQEQMKGSAQLEQWSVKLQQVQEELQESQQTEKKIRERLERAEEAERQLTAKNEALQQKLADAETREVTLHMVVAQQAEELKKAQELLKSADLESDELKEAQEELLLQLEDEQETVRQLKKRLVATEKRLAVVSGKAPADGVKMPPKRSKAKKGVKRRQVSRTSEQKSSCSD